MYNGIIIYHLSQTLSTSKDHIMIDYRTSISANIENYRRYKISRVFKIENRILLFTAEIRLLSVIPRVIT